MHEVALLLKYMSISTHGLSFLQESASTKDGLLVSAVLLTQASRQDMLEMVGITVTRLQTAPMQPKNSGPAAPKLLQSPQQDAAARDAHGGPGGQAIVENGGNNAAAPQADAEDTETGSCRDWPIGIFLRNLCSLQGLPPWS